MPRLPIDYSNTIIYKLCCNDISVTDVYVGHTTNFVKRKQQHKCHCNSNTAKSQYYVYQFIRDHGGWDNWSMIEICKVSCVDVNEAARIERQHIESLGATLNKQVPSRTLAEYNQDNKDKILERTRQYRQDNKEYFTERNRQYRSEHREELIEFSRQYYQDHREELLEKNRIYQQKRKEEYAEYRRQRYQKNKDELLEKRRLYYKENKDKINEQQRIKRAQKKTSANI